jgi:hypothetical protein
MFAVLYMLDSSLVQYRCDAWKKLVAEAMVCYIQHPHVDAPMLKRLSTVLGAMCEEGMRGHVSTAFESCLKRLVALFISHGSDGCLVEVLRDSHRERATHYFAATGKRCGAGSGSPEDRTTYTADDVRAVLGATPAQQQQLVSRVVAALAAVAKFDDVAGVPATGIGSAHARYTLHICVRLLYFRAPMLTCKLLRLIVQNQQHLSSPLRGLFTSIASDVVVKSYTGGATGVQVPIRNIGYGYTCIFHWNNIAHKLQYEGTSAGVSRPANLPATPNRVPAVQFGPEIVHMMHDLLCAETGVALVKSSGSKAERKGKVAAAAAAAAAADGSGGGGGGEPLTCRAPIEPLELTDLFFLDKADAVHTEITSADELPCTMSFPEYRPCEAARENRAHALLTSAFVCGAARSLAMVGKCAGAGAGGAPLSLFAILDVTSLTFALNGGASTSTAMPSSPSFLLVFMTV